MRIKRYVVGAALVALAVGYYFYKKKSQEHRGGNGKGPHKKAAVELKKSVKHRSAAR